MTTPKPTPREALSHLCWALTHGEDADEDVRVLGAALEQLEWLRKQAEVFQDCNTGLARELDALRAENAALTKELEEEEKAFDSQTTELENAVQVLEEVHPDCAMEFRYRTYPGLHNRPEGFVMPSFTAAEYRATALAARVEALEAHSLDLVGHIRALVDLAVHESGCDVYKPGPCNCGLVGALLDAEWCANAAPAADLQAHDDRIRRETVGNCHWAQDDYGWRTQCGVFWIFNGDGTDGTPEENGALFCHHCGKHLVPVTDDDRAAGITEPGHAGEE